MKLTKAEMATLRALHRRGYNDGEIAERMALSVRTVLAYRRKMGLSALPQSCRKRVEKLHDKGLLDREIAARIGKHAAISVGHVSAIRRSLGKKPHKISTPGSQRCKVHSFANYRARQLKSDSEIAALYQGLRYA